MSGQHNDMGRLILFRPRPQPDWRDGAGYVGVIFAGSYHAMDSTQQCQTGTPGEPHREQRQTERPAGLPAGAVGTEREARPADWGTEAADWNIGRDGSRDGTPIADDRGPSRSELELWCWWQ